jgi:hypothetical protein
MVSVSTFKRQRWMTSTVMSGHNFAERGFIPMLSWPFAMLRCASCLLQLSSAEVQETACNIRAAGCMTASAMDEAFKCTNQELSAHPKPRTGRVTEAQDAFNFHLSLQRQVIERCFALLVWRWGIFWRPIKVSFGSIKDLVACCCR